MVRAAPSGLRFWLTVDQRTNDTLSASAVCETCYSNTCCEALWLNCNRISFNRSKNTTQFPPIHRWQRHFVLTVKGPVWPRWPKISPCVTTKIMWNKTLFRENHISLWQIVHIKLNIPSKTHVATNFCYNFTIVLPVNCAIKSGPRGRGKLRNNLFFH